MSEVVTKYVKEVHGVKAILCAEQARSSTIPALNIMMPIRSMYGRMHIKEIKNWRSMFIK
jgi:hypothetical protein